MAPNWSGGKLVLELSCLSAGVELWLAYYAGRLIDGPVTVPPDTLRDAMASNSSAPRRSSSPPVRSSRF